MSNRKARTANDFSGRVRDCLSFSILRPQAAHRKTPGVQLKMTSLLSDKQIARQVLTPAIFGMMKLMGGEVDGFV
jgi:hypothetical protein